MTPDQWTEMFSDFRPALRVSFDGAEPSAGELYWRARVLWNFDGQSWSGSFHATDRPVPIPQPRLQPLRYRIALEPTDQRYLVMLDQPLEAPSAGRLTADLTVIHAEPVTSLLEYTGRSSPDGRYALTLAPAERRAALALPRDLNPRMQALARQWREEAGDDDSAIVRRALAWIEEDFSYSLTVPPTGRNGVDEFLFDQRVGFCQHFSSAFASLMRAAGIPARVVIGYAGGYRNRYGGYWVVRRMDAHAWNEVWLPGRGWLRVDPTAAVAPERVLDTVEDLARSDALLPDSFAPLRDLGDWARRNWNDLVLGFNAARQASLLRPLGIEQASSRQLGAAFAIGAGLALALTLWVLLRGRPTPRDPLVSAWLAFTRRMARSGLAKAASEPPLSFGERLALALPAQADALRSLSRRYADWRYAAQAAPPEEKARLIAELHAYRPTSR